MAKQVPLPRNSKASEARGLQVLPPGVEICQNNRPVSRSDVLEWQPQPGEHYESD